MYSLNGMQNYVANSVCECVCVCVCVTFLSIVDVVRGSHVTTVDGDRFCGADDNVGGFGNVLVTGRHTHANIFNVSFYFVRKFQ